MSWHKNHCVPRPQLAWRFIVVSTPLSCATALGLLQPGRGGGQVAT